MPLLEFNYNRKIYLLITQNKAHESKYREHLSRELIQKFGETIDKTDYSIVLKYMVNFYADQLTTSIRTIDDLSLIIFIYQLHEQSAELSYFNQKDFKVPVDYQYFSVYRRILKLILQESTFLKFRQGNALSKEWFNKATDKIEEMLYLGQFLIDITEMIAEINTVGNFINISFDNGLFTLTHHYGWGQIVSIVAQQVQEDLQESLVDEHIDVDFEENLQANLGFGLSDLRGALAALNDHFHNKNPPEIYNLDAILTVMEHKTETAHTFVSGLILNRDNVTSIANSVNKPYAGNNRIFNRPILSVIIDDEENYLVETYSFEEAINNFFQNHLSHGKIPSEWRRIAEIVKLKNKYEVIHKNLVEDAIGRILEEKEIVHDKNVKRLRKCNKQDISINNVPGEIDFIFILGDTIYIADCKNLTTRFEMRGFSEDISRFTKDYNLRMQIKLDFMTEHPCWLEEHLQILTNNSSFKLSNFKIEGIFIVNTATLYMMNAPFKIYTYNNFKKFVAGEDFFKKFISWTDGENFGKISYPYIDNFLKVMDKFD